MISSWFLVLKEFWKKIDISFKMNFPTNQIAIFDFECVIISYQISEVERYSTAFTRLFLVTSTKQYNIPWRFQMRYTQWQCNKHTGDFLEQYSSVWLPTNQMSIIQHFAIIIALPLVVIPLLTIYKNPDVLS